MTRRAFPWLAMALCLVAGTGLAAQSSQTEARGPADAVFAPYPDQIRVGNRGSEIVLTWTDSPDIRHGYRLYRHSQPPNQENYSQARLLAEVASGVEQYSYTATDDSPYYYFILGLSDNGGEYQLFLPLRNVTLIPVRAVLESPPELSPQTVRILINGLEAVRQNDYIRLSFVSDYGSGRNVIYRSVKPILGTQDLLDSVAIAVVDSSEQSYLDYPIPGIPYYYAVVPEFVLRAGQIGLVSGRNTTSQAVSVPAGLYRSGLPAPMPLSRSMPLPFLVLNRSIRDDGRLSVPERGSSQTFSVTVERSIQDLLAVAGTDFQHPRPARLIFSQDRQASGAGENFLLSQIVLNEFSSGDYAAAITKLNLLLSVPRSAALYARASFYRGQAYAFTGQWQEAFFDFLKAQDHHYTESRAWIDYLLDRLKAE